MPVGWVKLHRKLLDSETVHDDWLCRLWIICLLKANSKPGRFKGQVIEKGSFAFSYRVFSEYLGVSKNRLKRGLKKLENAEQISIKAGRDFSVVTLCNWSTYQSREIESGTPTDTRVDTPTDTQVDTQVDPEQERKKTRRKESKKKGGFDFNEILFPDGFDTPDMRDEYQQWIEYRMELKKPITTIQFNKTLQEFSEHGPAVMKSAISKSISSGWRGLFPPEERGTNARQSQAARPGQYNATETDDAIASLRARAKRIPAGG